MSFVRMRGRGVAAPFRVWVFALAFGLAREPVSARPAAPMFSKDGAVCVRAQEGQTGYRAPILVFVDRTRESLRQTVHLEVGSSGCPIEVIIGTQRDGDPRVVASQVRGPDGAVARERIELPDPEAADLARFRRAICSAFLRVWMAQSCGSRSAAKELPVWLIEGVLRYMDRETRQADADRMLLLWSNACLPTASELVAFDSWAAMREPAVAATLTAWLLERRPSGSAFEALLREIAAGAAWRADRVAAAVTGHDDALAFDAALDRWLLAEGRQVIRPGVTTDGAVRRFRAHLLLYPADCDKNVSVDQARLTFEEAVAWAGDPAFRRLAAMRATAVRLAAVGHDGMLHAVSDAYVRFLESFARGKKKEELLRLLREAENKRRELERETARGEVLRSPVAE